jgi:hypothetical protein
MIENIRNLLEQQADRIMNWYNGLEQLYQYGVFFLVIVVGLLFAAYLILSRITK